MSLEASYRRFSVPSTRQARRPRQHRRPRPLHRPVPVRPRPRLRRRVQPRPQQPPARRRPQTRFSRTDVEAILQKLAADAREDLDWRKSIVDLMKLLKLDSGLGARKQLAQELGYTSTLDGSAEMNIWLHKQVMTKLAESGGKVPDSLKA